MRWKIVGKSKKVPHECETCFFEDSGDKRCDHCFANGAAWIVGQDAWQPRATQKGGTTEMAMMERLTEHVNEKYIRIKGCKTLYFNEERKGAYLANAIVRLCALEDREQTK